MEATISMQILGWTFLIAVILGLVINKTNFCTMGAISDLVNLNHTGRIRAWILAVAIATLGVSMLEYLEWVNFDSTFPPYRQGEFPWLRYLLGGVLFGVGMTLASGCGNKTLVRIGGGNLKSLVVLVVMGVTVYFMSHPIHSETDKTIYEFLFYDLFDMTSFSVGPFQDIGAMLAQSVGGNDIESYRFYAGLGGSIFLFVWIFKSADFRSDHNNIVAGLVVGATVVLAWYITGGPLGIAWHEEVAWFEQSPKGVAIQSFSFVKPPSDLLVFLFEPQFRLISFGLVGLLGVIFGSFIWSLISGGLRVEWFNLWQDFFNHLVGGVLMGVGGVLAMGCSLGQGVTGVSTLALGSIVTLFSIVFASALTMKVSFYRIMYTQAKISEIVVTALVDLKVIPKFLRKLKSI